MLRSFHVPISHLYLSFGQKSLGLLIFLIGLFGVFFVFVVVVVELYELFVYFGN